MDKEIKQGMKDALPQICFAGGVILVIGLGVSIVLAAKVIIEIIP